MRWALIGAGLLALFGAGCGAARHGRGGASADWLAGHGEPAFDPDGPPEPLRGSIERLLSRGLMDEDATGRIVPAAAESIRVSRDGLTVTFRLRRGLRYTDGQACTSADFRAALEGGLTRTEHGTRGLLLAAVRGVEAVRLGRALPRLGIETPDERTLLIRLSRPDSLLPRKLSLPGVSSPWRSRSPGQWRSACGIGPYRVLADQRGRLTLARVLPCAGPDTLRIRFVLGAPRTRALLRDGRVDLVWPLPPGFLDQPIPPGFHGERLEARPARRLVLVMRADTPPTVGLPARRAIAHALNRSEVMSTIGAIAAPAGSLLPGAGAFDFPKYDAGEVERWMERGHLGRSFEVSMAYDADGAGAALARPLQGGWARLNLYVTLHELRGAAFANEALMGTSQLVLAETQPLCDRPEYALAQYVMPIRGPAAGGVRTGWRTREWDAWLLGRRGSTAFPAALAQQRLEQELFVLPLASLPWLRIVREGGLPEPFHPHFGPDFARNPDWDAFARRSAIGSR